MGEKGKRKGKDNGRGGKRERRGEGMERKGGDRGPRIYPPPPWALQNLGPALHA